MERTDKIKFLESVLSGETNIKQLRRKNVWFILPAKDGTTNVEVFSTYTEKKVYTREQYDNLKKKMGWQ